MRECLVTKYLRARRDQGLDAVEAVRYSFATVGVALWTTTLALAAGFLVISTSAFSVNAEMGLLVAVVVVMCGCGCGCCCGCEH